MSGWSERKRGETTLVAVDCRCHAGTVSGVDPRSIRIPTDLLPVDGRFGCGPSKVRPEQLDALAAAGRTLRVPPEYDAGHVYHLFPVLSGERDALKARLEADGVETLIHFPVPIPRQPALATEEPADCPVASRICNELLSLPLYPDMADAAVDDVLAALDHVTNAG